MRKYAFMACMGMIFLTGGLWAAEPSTVSEKEKTKTTSTWEEKNADQVYVYLLNSQELTLNDDWSFDEHVHYRVKIQKEQGKSLGEQSIYYNKSREEIKEINAYVKTPDGKVHQHTKIQDLAVYEGSPMYSDFRVKVITLPQVNVGSIIDIEVKVKTTHSVMKNHFWRVISPPLFPVKYAKQSFTFPADKDIKFRSHNIDYEPLIEEKDGRINYTFVFEETEDFYGEDNMPPFDEVLGLMTLSSIQDWSEIAEWYRDLAAKNTVTDESIEEQAKKLLEGKKTDSEKVKAVLEYIQDNFRYVSMSFGDNTVEPHPTTDIFNNKYGDCKDWSLLTKQMLKVAGIESHITLFNVEDEGNPQNGLPRVSAFNHVILEILLGDRRVFVDPQLKGYDFGQYPLGYEGAHLFVIEDDTSRFANIPISDGKGYMLYEESQVFIDEEGGATYDANVTFGIDYSQPLRLSWSALSDKDKEKFYEVFETMITKGGELVEREWEGMDNRYGPISLKVKFKKPNAFPIMNDMMILSNEETSQDFMPMFSEKERKYPIFVRNSFTIKSVTTYHVPKKFNIDYVPKDYRINIDFMDIGRTFIKEENKITETETVRTKRSRMSAKRYPEVKRFLKEYFKKRNKYVVLKGLEEE